MQGAVTRPRRLLSKALAVTLKGITRNASKGNDVDEAVMGVNATATTTAANPTVSKSGGRTGKSRLQAATHW